MKKELIQHLPDFYKNYVNLVTTDDLLGGLLQEFDITRDFLLHLPAEKDDFRYAENKWSIKEIMGHLIDAERIMAYRALRFARKDNTELAGFEENEYVPNSGASLRSKEDLLDEYAALRTSTHALFKSFTEEMLMQSGIANHKRISVLGFGYIIIGHEMHHRKIIQERYL